MHNFIVDYLMHLLLDVYKYMCIYIITIQNTLIVHVIYDIDVCDPNKNH